ncbi:MAG: hypothetical protein OCU18_03935 [Candidatus Syntrophoarchaeum sp.]|nr:hypothetical protein [Candidatus Syntrophoarchaeum sp.]
MTTRLDLKNEVRRALGGNDSDAATAGIERGLNAGLVAAAYLFEPPEVRETGTLNTASDSGRTVTSSLTRPMAITSVYSTTTDKKIFRLEFEQMDMPWVPSSGDIQYYCLRGSYLYYRPQAAETLTVYYLKRPPRLENDTDAYPFETLEDFVVAFGTAYAWAFLEENENVSMWNVLADRMSIPEARLLQVKQIMDGNIITAGGESG